MSFNCMGKTASGKPCKTSTGAYYQKYCHKHRSQDHSDYYKHGLYKDVMDLKKGIKHIAEQEAKLIWVLEKMLQVFRKLPHWEDTEKTLDEAHWNCGVCGDYHTIDREMCPDHPKQEDKEVIVRNSSHQ